MERQVIVGAGPVGSGVATLLADRGVPVTVLTRSGSGPQHPLIKLAKGDAEDADLLTASASGAAAIYNCVNPPYHGWATDWPPVHRALMAAAERTGAVLVMMDNLYAFGPAAGMPMCENGPMQATGTKGATRAMMARELLRAHADGRLRATLARGSDFFGPGVRNAALGERVVPKVIAGKNVSVLGDPDQPHSLSYMPDVVRTLVTIAGDERAWGKPWHVPNASAVTQREAVALLAGAAGTTVKVNAVPKWVVRGMGVFVPMMRELLETWYQFDRPFVTDSTLTERTFNLTATPLDEASGATIAWWREQMPN